MNGTIHASGGFPLITESASTKTRWRVGGLVLAAFLGSLLVAWMSRTTWERVDLLQHEFGELHPDSFYLGARMRNNIVRMDDTLLRYRLHGDEAEAEAFRLQARDFKERLDHFDKNAATHLELVFLNTVQTAYGTYLQESAKLLQTARARLSAVQARDFEESYEKVHAQSRLLISLCDTFIDNQRADFDRLLRESDSTLANFKQLLQISAAALLALAAALLFLIYRVMIAPLRHQLTESQAIIARQEKLASLGVLAAGVAHEIRNPLTAIKFRLFSLKKLLPAEADEDAGVIGGEIVRLERIVKDFLQFARPSDPQLAPMPAQRIVQEVQELLRPQLEKSAIELKVEPSEEVWVLADIQQIKQVLINLVHNAADSIGRDGVVTLRVAPQKTAHRRRPGYVALEVSDTGKGIPLDVQKRLFDPFFTTKEGGTGLGLPIAASIVEKHGGQLRYQTTHHRGTTFQVLLPQTTGDES